MDLTLHQPGNVYAVTALTDQGIRIAATVYPRSLILSAERIEHPWPVGSVRELDAAVARDLLTWKPEIVIVGTGDRLRFPPPEFSATLMGAGVGCEAMDNPAACRTYNVLVTEERKVLAALIQPER